MEHLPERHLECSDCKKPNAICYTEIVGKTIYRVVMCKDCPLLQHKLYGFMAVTEEEAQNTGLCCGSCGIRADEVRMGALLGCSLCYEVFDDLIIHELTVAGRMHAKLVARGIPLHTGRIPGQLTEENVSMKLLTLHQALNETLSREDYEQAAWLRDQIKKLTEGAQVDDEGKP